MFCLVASYFYGLSYVWMTLFYCFNFHSLALKTSNNEATPLQTEYISLDPSEAMVNIIMYIMYAM